MTFVQEVEASCDFGCAGLPFVFRVGTHRDAVYEVHIFDSYGTLKTRRQSVGGQDITVNGSELTGGIYQVVVKGVNMTDTYKVIITK